MMCRLMPAASVAAVLALAACSGGGTGNSQASIPNAVPATTQSETFADSVNTDATKVLTIHVGFSHAALPTSPYGPLAFYAPNTGATHYFKVKAGSKVKFLNDDKTRHTASGLGIGGFPTSFDNTSGLNPVGTTINSGLTWSSGSLNPGASSKTFTVGPAAVYYFGCYYHYRVNPSMRDVIVSTAS